MWAAAEAVILDAPRLGSPSPAAYAEAHKEAGARMAQLRDRVTRKLSA